MKNLDMSKYNDWKKYIDSNRCEYETGCYGCQYNDSTQTCERFAKIRSIELGEEV